MILAGVPTQLLSMGCEGSYLFLLLACNVRPHKTGRHRWICGSEKSDCRANRRHSVGHKRSSPRQIGRFTNSRAEPLSHFRRHPYLSCTLPRILSQISGLHYAETRCESHLSLKWRQLQIRPAKNPLKRFGAMPDAEDTTYRGAGGLPHAPCRLRRDPTPRLPALFRKRLSPRSRPVDLASRHRASGHSPHLRRQVASWADGATTVNK